MRRLLFAAPFKAIVRIRKRLTLRIVVFVLSTMNRYTFAAAHDRDACQTEPPRAPASDQPAPRPTRPPVHRESWSKVAVVLFDGRVVHLGRLATANRGKTGKLLNRAEIIR